MDFPTLYALTDDELIDGLVYIQAWLNTRSLNLSAPQLVKASSTVYGYEGKILWPGVSNNDIPEETVDEASIEKWTRGYIKVSEKTLGFSEQFKRPASIKTSATAFNRIRKFDLYFQIRPIYRARKILLLQAQNRQVDSAGRI